MPLAGEPGRLMCHSGFPFRILYSAQSWAEQALNGQAMHPSPGAQTHVSSHDLDIILGTLPSFLAFNTTQTCS